MFISKIQKLNLKNIVFENEWAPQNIFSYVYKAELSSSCCCIHIHLCISQSIYKYVDSYAFQYSLEYLNTLKSVKSRLFLRCWVFSHLSWCTVHRTSVEHVPTRIIGSYITLLLYPLSTIPNYHCLLLHLYVHIVLIFNCIYYAFLNAFKHNSKDWVHNP